MGNKTFQDLFDPNLFFAYEIMDALRDLNVDFECANIRNDIKYQFCSLQSGSNKNGFYFSVDGYAATKNITTSLVLTNSKKDAQGDNSLIIVDEPQLIFYKLMNFFFREETSTFIHPTAIVSPKAYIAENVYIGPFCVIEDSVINSDVHLHSHITIMRGTTIGKGVRIDSGSSIGVRSIAWAWDKKSSTRVIQPQIGYTSIGNNCLIGSNCSIGRGSVNETTTIGNNVVIAQGARIAHGCIVGDDCHFGNSISLSGNVTIGKKSFIGSGSVIRSMVNIAPKNIVAAGAVVVKNSSIENTVLIGVPAKPQETTKTRLSGIPDISGM
ncbi:DapH/DapD/GlmU-related protein [Vibrio sp. WXL210]|uniref:DapH/DapD/GlmU-related protein n=1 Tax=Vibrio sp. WXL210 TaxID=3450709 RepID=UPI003EC5E808